MEELKESVLVEEEEVDWAESVSEEREEEEREAEKGVWR